MKTIAILIFLLGTIPVFSQNNTTEQSAEDSFITEQYLEDLFKIRPSFSSKKDENIHNYQNKDQNIIKYRLDSMIIIGNFKDRFIYDTAWNIFLQTNFDSYQVENRWDPRKNKEFIYNENNMLIQVNNYNWDNNIGSWKSDIQTDYIYNDDQILIQTFNYEWFASSSQWVNHSKTYYSYDDNGNMILETSYDWVHYSSDWASLSKTENFFDENNKLVLNIIYSWNQLYVRWDNTHKTENTYDSYGNLAQSIDYFWADYADDWKEMIKSNYEYETNIYYSELIIPVFYSEDYFHHKPLRIELCTTNAYNGLWEHYIDMEFYYSILEFASIDENKTEIIEIYPNPVEDFINFNIPYYKNAEFKLYSLYGQKILNHRICQDNSLCLKHLKPGLYLYSISLNGVLHNGKLIKN